MAVQGRRIFVLHEDLHGEMSSLSFFYGALPLLHQEWLKHHILAIDCSRFNSLHSEWPQNEVLAILSEIGLRLILK